MRISNLSNKSGSLTSSDKFVLDNGTNVMKIDYNALAKAIIEQYTGSTLAGSAQSVKAALDSLNSNTKTVEGTTNSVGIINLGLAAGSVEIISITSGTSGQWCIPAIFGANLYAKVLTNSASYAVVASTDVTLTVRYRTI